MDEEVLKSALLKIRTGGIHNYVLPGLSSYRIGDEQTAGMVRLFVASRNTKELITPHSHRFDFTAFVLSGAVENTIYAPSSNVGDTWWPSKLVYGGEVGKYEQRRQSPVMISRYWEDVVTYKKGEHYSMDHKEIHSIKFSRDAVVLFIEGPRRTSETTILEQCDGITAIPSFKTEPWMFQKD